jgi:hypothetical protein
LIKGEAADYAKGMASSARVRRGKEFDDAAAGALGHDATIAGSASSRRGPMRAAIIYFAVQHDPMVASTSTKRMPAA